MIIKEMAITERPREKAFQYGIESLSNQELLAVMLRSGTKDESALVLAMRILNKSGGLNGLHRCTISELMSIKGIKKAKALSIISAIELAKRMQMNDEVKNMFKITNAKDVYDYMKAKLMFEQQEKFYVLFLNTHNEIIHEKLLFSGTVNSSVIHPREIFKEALAYNGANIICVHNHPGGSLQPSNSDIETTKRLNELGQTMQVYLLDHVIISSCGYCSMRQKGLF